MRILHIAIGRHLYAEAQQALHLIQGLEKRGIQGTLICTEESVIAIAAIARGLEVITVPPSGNFDLVFVFRLRRLIRQVRPSLVHVHSRQGADVLGGLAAFLAGIPSVLVRGVDSHDTPLLGRSNYWFYRRVLATSNYIHRHLREHGLPDRKLRRVGNGVDEGACRPTWSREKFEREFHLKPDDFTIAVVDKLVAKNGHRYLLDALPKICAAYTGVRVLFFGSGPLEERLKKAVKRKGLSSNVHFAGHRTDLLEFLGHVQLLVHPAIREGRAVNLLEAQAAGVPVVGFRLEGIAEAIAESETGTLVPVRDSESLAAAVIRLIYRPKERREMSDTARQWATGEFSLDRMVQGNMDVYGEILELSEVGQV